MLNIWKRENSFLLNCQWNGGRSKDDFTLQNINSWYGEPIENNQDVIDFQIKYKTLETKKVDIKEEDIIYFFKESKYPRFKFTSNCKNLKTIQIPKATWLVTPIFTFFNTHNTIKTGIECTLTNKIYFSNYNGTNNATNKCHTLYKKQTPLESFIALLQDKFIIQGNNYREVECISLYNYNNFNVKAINDINDNIDKCITEKNLEEYISSNNSNEFTEELYKSLDVMLKSKDASTIELGIKMLNNFDVKKNSLQIGSLLRLNSEVICNNKALTTVGFKNVMTQLGTTFNDIRYDDVLSYYNTLYKVSENKDDKSKIQEYATVEIKKRLQQIYDKCNSQIIIPTTLTLEIT